MKNKISFKSFTNFFVILFLFLYSSLLRFKGAGSSYPFWVDEFSTANQANLLIKYGLHFFTQNSHYIEINKLIPTALTALSFEIFGRSESAARLPFILIGSTIPVAIYLIFCRLSSKVIAFCSAILISSSYFMIVWSRQARGYVLLQLLILVFLSLYISWLKSRQKKTGILLFLTGTLGVLTHQFFFIAIVAIAIHIWFFEQKRFLIIINTNKLLSTIFLFFFVFIISNLFIQIWPGVLSGALKINNNFWYYHSFLWREYSLVTFLGIIGLLIALYKNFKSFSVFIIYIILHLLFITFIFGPYVSRYLLPIWPLFLFGVAYSVSYFMRLFLFHENFYFKNLLSLAAPIVIIGIFVINGNDFVLKPKEYYSVNHDFREIALVDYDQIYNVIKKRGELNKGNTAVIDTWADRLEWYIGSDYEGSYFFRWENSGLMKETKYEINDKGEKIIPQRAGMLYVGNLDDFKKVQKKYPKGFIFIDDDTLPYEIVNFVKKNLKNEMFVSRYYLDDNPYSNWPATLYSWGVK